MPSERTFRRVLAAVDGDALDSATCGYAADVVRGDVPAPHIPAAVDEPAEREQRRAVTLAVTHPAPAGLLPAVAIDGKLLHGSRTKAGQVFLAAAVTHQRAVILGRRQVADERGETTSTEPLLTPLNVADMLLTLDALNTTKKTVRLITASLNAHYLSTSQEIGREPGRGDRIRERDAGAAACEAGVAPAGWSWRGRAIVILWPAQRPRLLHELLYLLRRESAGGCDQAADFSGNRMRLTRRGLTVGNGKASDHQQVGERHLQERRDVLEKFWGRREPATE